MKKQNIFVKLFFLPFLGGGLFTGFMFVQHFVEVRTVSSWEKVQAKILSAKHGTNRSGDSETKFVKANYDYQYGGVQYRGTRVGIVDSGGIGWEYKKRAATLAHHARNRRLKMIYVNPHDPSESIVYPEPVWGYAIFLGLFSLVFTLVGAGGLWLVGSSSKSQVNIDDLKARYPEQPWRWEPEWEQGVISNKGGTRAATMWFLAIIWNAISCPVLFVFPEEWASGNRLIALGLVFSFVGAGFIYVALMATLRHRKYGNANLHLEKNPGVIGGKLLGEISLRKPISVNGPVSLTLNCMQTVTTGSGSNRSSNERLVWQDEKEVTVEGGRMFSIPIDFSIPYGRLETSSEKSIRWELQVRASTPGIDFQTSYTVPVFNTDESDETITEASLIEDSNVLEEPSLLDSKDLTVSIEVRAKNDIEISVPPMLLRHPGAVLSLGLFTLLWTGAIALIVHLEAPIIFPVVFGLFEILFFLCLADWVFSRRRIVIRENALRTDFSCLFLRKNRSVPLGTVERVTMNMCGSSNTGSNHKAKYTVSCDVRNGKSVTLISDIYGRKRTEAIVGIFKEAMGLSSERNEDEQKNISESETALSSTKRRDEGATTFSQESDVFDPMAR